MFSVQPSQSSNFFFSSMVPSTQFELQNVWNSIYRNLFRKRKSSQRRFQVLDPLPYEDPDDTYAFKVQRPAKRESFAGHYRPFTLASCNSPIRGASIFFPLSDLLIDEIGNYHVVSYGIIFCICCFPGLSGAPPDPRSGSETYYSTFHNTPEPRKFSEDEWESFTRESTKKALEELVASADFSKWAVANAERITLSPPIKAKPGTSNNGRGRWFFWFWVVEVKTDDKIWRRVLWLSYPRISIWVISRCRRCNSC